MVSAPVKARPDNWPLAYPWHEYSAMWDGLRNEDGEIEVQNFIWKTGRGDEVDEPSCRLAHGLFLLLSRTRIFEYPRYGGVKLSELAWIAGLDPLAVEVVSLNGFFLLPQESQAEVLSRLATSFGLETIQEPFSAIAVRQASEWNTQMQLTNIQPRSGARGKFLKVYKELCEAPNRELAPLYQNWRLRYTSPRQALTERVSASFDGENMVP